MIRPHQDLSYYTGAKDAVDTFHRKLRDIEVSVLKDIALREAEVTDMMAEAMAANAAVEENTNASV